MTDASRLLDSLSEAELQAWRMTLISRGSAGAPETQAPRGWFAVGFSDSLESGQVAHAAWLGGELAIWRGSDGVVRALDAYCPHQRENMGLYGVVRGTLLECPRHLWRWDGEGACREIPYAPKIPAAAQKKGCARSWAMREAHGMVYVWSGGDVPRPTALSDDFQHWEIVERGEWRMTTPPLAGGEPRSSVQAARVGAAGDVDLAWLGARVIRFDDDPDLIVVLANTPVTARALHTRCLIRSAPASTAISERRRETIRSIARRLDQLKRVADAPEPRQV